MKATWKNLFQNHGRDEDRIAEPKAGGLKGTGKEDGDNESQEQSDSDS